ncbi:hypothetical protein SERLA73DRAFT_166860 [Serpula lacrymans var. lacrymans S7.3]|uniref:Uncharacterized protein n=2 Tax=Serpula lacrymans var. lacrymans TaxID=341189 RepID=F8PRC3_SERL3|nr:uncharacterized protein SERLADRAFT_462793 [Serpula lacrymans var. lacrymans S7.9]EGO00546.1 hypothetical protein SERLA73DRAFT_166860 [Serpula lacrymans var. lacrymans S7.3]EGO26103.1 hypothetical protein SERLADRAFT_462793 [Serpula lacrymans var. lacrymans S7.9]
MGNVMYACKISSGLQSVRRWDLRACLDGLVHPMWTMLAYIRIAKAQNCPIGTMINTGPTRATLFIRNDIQC